MLSEKNNTQPALQKKKWQSPKLTVLDTNIIAGGYYLDTHEGRRTIIVSGHISGYKYIHS